MNKTHELPSYSFSIRSGESTSLKLKRKREGFCKWNSTGLLLSVRDRLRGRKEYVYSSYLKKTEKEYIESREDEKAHVYQLNEHRN